MSYNFDSSRYVHCIPFLDLFRPAIERKVANVFTKASQETHRKRCAINEISVYIVMCS